MTKLTYVSDSCMSYVGQRGWVESGQHCKPLSWVWLGFIKWTHVHLWQCHLWQLVKEQDNLGKTQQGLHENSSGGVRIFVQPIVSRDVSVLILQTYLWGNNGNNCRYTRCLSRLPNERNKAKQYSLLQLAYSSLSGVDRCSSKSSQIILCSFMAVLGHGQGAVVPGLAWKEAKMASRHD